MQILRYDSIDSTQRLAKQCVLDGQVRDEPIVVVAGEQQIGCGRFDRQWKSPPGGLYMTYVQPLPDPQAVAGLALRVGLITCEVLETCAGLTAGSLRIKWPNDVLADGKKLSGILCEMVSRGAERWILIGIGVNANFRCAGRLRSDEAPLRTPAASLLDMTGSEIDLDDLLGRLSAGLSGGLVDAGEEGLSARLRQRLEARLHGLHQGIHLRLPDGSSMKGRIIGLDSQGCLRLGGSCGETTAPGGAEIVEIGENCI